MTQALRAAVVCVGLPVAAGAAVFVAIAGHSDPSPAVGARPLPAGLEPTRFVATDGNDAHKGCRSRAAPCATFDAAYRAARPGERVQVAGGIYPTQRLTADPSKRSRRHVVIAPAPHARVRIGDLQVKAKHVTIRDIAVRDVALNVNTEINGPADLTAEDVTLRRLDGRTFEVLSASDVRIEGGDWGPSSACGGPDGGGNNAIRQYPGGPPPRRVTIDGASIHRIRSFDLSACHTEGLAIFAGRNIVVRRSRFWGNDVYNLFVQANSGADPIIGVTIEHNSFGATSREAGTGVGYWTAEFDGVHIGLRIRHNRFVQAMAFSAAARYTDSDVIGNVGVLAPGACALPGLVYAHNVWRNGRCAASDVRRPR